MISPELVKEICGKKAYSRDNEVWIPIDEFEGAFEGLNIHELAHKCKEWAINEGFWLETYINHSQGRCSVNNAKWERVYKTTQTTEPEAIFKATSYIMEQLKDKG